MKSVAGIAFENGTVFIAKRKAGGDVGGKWEFPGGKVEEGENDAHALRREYREEFSTAVETGPLLASAEFTHKGNRFTLNAYRIFWDSHNFRMTEHSEWRWASLCEIKTLDFVDSDRKLLPALEAYFKAQNGIDH